MPRRNPLWLRLPGSSSPSSSSTTEELRLAALSPYSPNDDISSIPDSLEHSPAKTSDDGSEISRANFSSPSSPSRSPSKKVSWSLFDQVSLSGEEFLLPRRFEAIELNAGTSTRSTSISCSATDLLESDHVTIRKISLQDPATARREYRNIILCRLLPHPNILPISEAYEVDSTLYTVSEQMDGRLSDIVEERLTHFVVAKISHQILAAVAMMHQNGIAHGDLTLSTIYVNTDAELRLSSYGKSDDSSEHLDERYRDDLLSIGAIVSRFLMNEEEMFKFSKSRNLKDIDWRVVLEGSSDSGLLDFNARSLLFQLLEGRQSARDLLRHPYFKSFRAPQHQTVERKHTVVGQKTSDEVLDKLREELQRFNPFNMSEIML
ncbi:Protein kinase domain-containing protein [Caenorhabditis elegans]|uniref:Protein kinase domain-containing protein n=1 Tax=Caenorhabditis elegans TaxID=6239 RepID=P91376_CAEEL|nr:Protein kinase domain-containing protein [Caenorhabditis elegans]CCD70979.1 Protein kinase domain-containing protein [Caenorhabditis elegans]|eukprot:NP_499962.2 Uncharacterized protein CELE_K11H12.9 [Caenorhabditis elegans]